MSKVGQDMIASLKEAKDFMGGKRTGVKVHIPRAIDTKRIRRKVNMTQEAFADYLDVPLGTLRGWEQGRRVPDGAARTLIRMVDADPEGVHKIMQKVA